MSIVFAVTVMQAKDEEAAGHMGPAQDAAAVKGAAEAEPGTGQRQQQHEQQRQGHPGAEDVDMADADAQPSARPPGAAEEASAAAQEEEQHDGRPAKKQRLGAHT